MKESKDNIAVAMRYDQEQDTAPRVVASGKGRVATKIVEKARESGVAIKEQPELAEALVSLEIGQVIPSELYLAVAEVLAYVYNLDLQSTKRVKKS